MLNEKKREERTNPLAFIQYGNIFLSHTHCGYENKQVGDGGDGRSKYKSGRDGKLGETNGVICFSEQEKEGEEMDRN